jgi:hypothetical protein
MKSSTKKQTDTHLDNGELSVLLTRLQVASKRLNAAAEEAGRRILAVEELLAEAEPGVAVWSATLLTEPTTFQRVEGQAPEAAERVLTLGYAKVKKDKWGIAVREVVKSTSGALLSDERSLLSKTERAVRLLAVSHLESLARQVVETVEAQAAALSTGHENEAARDIDPARSSGEAPNPAHN